MMDGKFQLNDRVKLKGDRADVYPRAFGSSEGVIKNHKMDPLGHHVMVYVQWDKNHWAYNGEDDMWTFEDHFDLVESKVMPKEEKPDLAAALAEFLKAWNADEPLVREEDGDDEAAANAAATYASLVEEASDYAQDCEAFLTVAVKRTKDKQGRFVLVPELFSFYKSEAAGLLLESQLAQIVMTSHLELSEQAIQVVMKADSDA